RPWKRGNPSANNPTGPLPASCNYPTPSAPPVHPICPLRADHRERPYAQLQVHRARQCLSRRWLQSICQSWHQSRPAQTSATGNPNLSFHNKLQSHQEWQLPSFFLLRSILKSSRLLLKQFTAAILDISASDTVRSSTPPIQKKA